MSSSRVVRALTISGSDSGGGAGIQADLKTFAALGVYGASVITAVTARNTLEVAAIAEVPEEVVIAQIDTVVHDIGANAVKTGMLSSKPIVENVADRLEAWGIPHLVVDPVMLSRDGVALLQPDATDALRKDLLPLASIVTPNLAEAEVLANRHIASPAHAQEAAKAIAAMGPRTVIIKGGHLLGSSADLVYHDGRFIPYEGTRPDIDNTHGTRCTYSAAITAFLALGFDTLEAIRLATSYIENAQQHAVRVGEGSSPVAHFAPLPEDIRQALDGVRK